MILEIGLFLMGILGILVFIMVLTHLSARMGEGLCIPKYYFLFFISILFILMAIPAGWPIYLEGNKDTIETLFILLTLGNIIAIATSYKYWWWLTNELWAKGGK